MTSVTFTPETGGDGSTITDDNDPATGLGNSGHRVRFVPTLVQVVATTLKAVQKAAEAVVSATASASSAASSASSANTANTHKNAAEVSAQDSADSAVLAQSYASVAQAVSPDSPMRLNSSKVIADFVVPAGSNAVSGGDIEITNNITVTVSPFSTWSIT